MGKAEGEPTTYRLAMPEDAPRLADLRWQYHLEESPVRPGVGETDFIEACGAFFRRSFASGRWTCWFAEDEGIVVAHAFVNVIDSVPWPHRLRRRFGYLTNVYTRPAYRGRGIGAELLERVTTWAADENLELLIVWPSEKSGEFYRRAGFELPPDILQLTLRDD